MNHVFKALLALSALTLAGCASAPQPLPRATAAPETVRVSMDVSARDNGLTWNQIDVINAVATEYKARGHGPLVISYPQNAGNADAAISAIAEARTQLYAAGLDWRQIAGGAYEAGGRTSAPVIFSFTRYQAIAPECDTRWNDMANVRANENWPRFGCATANNLANMVADPRDLVAPRTMDGPDTGRRQTVLDNYRQGESTASQRSDRESGAVSSSVGN
ncbi:CpaD family pilus assembly protein [Oceanicaulis sp. MMSF_3324]|uniref:CpaD family pilus assembly protein n=1 Tax=Oceanicaulis sp. MMSF_3324 TaxID=3046702 RepID=UPI00273D975B|nr:CpaD family pilus assembly protein [Oceanicaulis sp. MMSF_3324]